MGRKVVFVLAALCIVMGAALLGILGYRYVTNPDTLKQRASYIGLGRVPGTTPTNLKYIATGIGAGSILVGILLLIFRPSTERECIVAVFGSNINTGETEVLNREEVRSAVLYQDCLVDKNGKDITQYVNKMVHGQTSNDRSLI